MARSHIVTIQRRRETMLELIGNPPLLTVLIAATCILIFIIQSGHGGVGAVCLYPARVVTRFELYRLLIFPYFHGGFIHILFNMIAWIYLGKEFELMMGTLGAAYCMFVLLVPLSAILHCVSAFLLDALASTQFRNECAIGISGLLFSILVFNLQMSGATSVSFFGFFNIPARWYPWILALLLQLLSSNLSLLGHLSGIVLGYALAYGWLRGVSPSEFKLQEVEENMGLTRWPLWQSISSAMGVSFGVGSGLPQSSGSGASFGERIQAAWQGLTSWFAARTSGAASDQPFVGEGRALGGDSPRPTTGRVPPTSRLLQVVSEVQPSTTQIESSEDESGDPDPQAKGPSEKIPSDTTPA